jgi:hypothetical protein
VTSLQLALEHRLTAERAIERLHMHIEELRAFPAPTEWMESILRRQEERLVKIDLHIANLQATEQRRQG